MNGYISRHSLGIHVKPQAMKDVCIKGPGTIDLHFRHFISQEYYHNDHNNSTP